MTSLKHEKQNGFCVLNYCCIHSALTDGQFWRDVKDTDDPVQGAIGGDMSIAMSNTSVYLARKYYAEIFGINVKDVPEPNSAVSCVMYSL